MINLNLYKIPKKRKINEEEINKKNAKGPPGSLHDGISLTLESSQQPCD